MSNLDLKKRIKLTSYDSLFDTESTRNSKNSTLSTGNDNGLMEIRLRDLHTFKNHPFSVIEDEKMDDLVKSISEYGVLSPGLARLRPEGGYELISGHRRRHAAIRAGLTTMPVIVRDLDDDEAVILMVDANLQRENVFPSEKAKAYAMKYAALKHQGHKTGAGRTLESMAQDSGESSTQIQRYIRLADLIEEMLILLDDGKLQMRPGVHLAELDEDAQILVFELLKKDHINITELQALEVKHMYWNHTLTMESLKSLLCVEKETRRKVSFGAKKLDHYFTPNTSNKDIEKLIIRLLEDWKAGGGTL